MPFSPESERGLHFIAQSIGKEQKNLQIKQTDNDDDDVTTKTPTTNTFLRLQWFLTLHLKAVYWLYCFILRINRKDREEKFEVTLSWKQNFSESQKCWQIRPFSLSKDWSIGHRVVPECNHAQRKSYILAGISSGLRLLRSRNFATMERWGNDFYFLLSGFFYFDHDSDTKLRLFW